MFDTQNANIAEPHGKRPIGLFVTGSDTGIGKTYVSQVLLRQLGQCGFTPGAYKPVATGWSEHEPNDAELLWHAIDRRSTLDQVCPQRFSAPLAPPLAADVEGRQVDPQLLRHGIKPWRESCNYIIVEGAGGLLSPIAWHQTNADLARDLGYPLVIVVANRLGAVNQALMTLQSAKSHSLTVALLVLCDLNPNDEQVYIEHRRLLESTAPHVLSGPLPAIAQLRFGERQLKHGNDFHF